MYLRKLYSVKFLLLIISLNFYSIDNYSQDREIGIFQYPDGIFAAGVKSVDFKKAIESNDLQKQSMWCWATCVAMVLRFQNLNVSQEDVVYKAFNRLVNEPGNGRDMVKGANGWNYNGKSIRAWIENSRSAKVIIDDLAHKYPLVVGIDNPGQKIGHAYVLTAIYFKGDINGTIIPIKIALRDPWPWPGNKDGRVKMSWRDFISKVNTIIHVTY